jgi:hypothetical protein
MIAWMDYHITGGKSSLKKSKIHHQIYIVTEQEHGAVGDQINKLTDEMKILERVYQERVRGSPRYTVRMATDAYALFLAALNEAPPLVAQAIEQIHKLAPQELFGVPANSGAKVLQFPVKSRAHRPAEVISPRADK